MGLREGSERAADANRNRVVRKLGTGRRPILLISKRMEISNRGPIFPFKRRPAKTWQSTLLSHGDGDELRKSLAVCIGRLVVVR
jgi:hypothetical protein